MQDYKFLKIRGSLSPRQQASMNVHPGQKVGVRAGS